MGIMSPGTEIIEAIKEGRLKVDMNGHNRSADSLRPYHLAELKFIHSEADEQLLEVLKNPEAKPLKKPVAFYGSMVQCDECAKRLRFVCDGRTLTATTDDDDKPCEYPNGIPPFVWELDVPSGKMVVGNDFRKAFKAMGDYDVNYTIGSYKTTMQYAAIGMSHAFVGNTCPSVFKINKQKFAIGCKGADESNPVKGSRRVAGIITDLWWFSIVDYNDYCQRYGHDPSKERHHEVIECRPGVYKFTHHYFALDHDKYDVPQLYTDIEWVREPDPVVDHEAEYMKLNYTAGQVILDSLKRWPDLYGYRGGKPSDSSIARAADQLLVTLGAGQDYHPNGWFGDSPDLKPDAPDLEIPVFDRQYHWYGLHDISALPQIAGVGKKSGHKDTWLVELNDSFAALAFNILNCMVKYGLPENNKDDGKRNAETLKYAKKCLVALAKRWPDRVPDYARDTIKGLKNGHG